MRRDNNRPVIRSQQRFLLKPVAFLAVIVLVIFFQLTLQRKLFSMLLLRQPSSKGEYTNSNLSPPPKTFSACLMFKDDTHLLTEWLAYHYHVLLLRRLIIGVDGGPESFPMDLINRYSGRIQITLWSRNIFAPDWMMNSTDRHRNYDDAQKHIRRQMLLLRQCALRLKHENRTWTAFLDPDEYLVFNHQLYVPTLSPMIDSEETRQTGVQLPNVREEGVIYKFLQTNKLQRKISENKPCVTIPRLLFGSHISSDHSSRISTDNTVPPLMTMRYRSHANRTNFKANRLSKTVLQLQYLSIQQLSRLKNMHSPVPEVCQHPQLIHADNSLLIINHYLGSQASFSHRKDARNQFGRLQLYQRFQNVQEGTDDTITSWYEGFERVNGRETALKLLEGATVL
jgi:hypothetical protein